MNNSDSNHNMGITPLWSRLAGLGCLLFAIFAFSSSASAQGFDLEGYLRKKDVNRNGRLDPEELSNNTRSMLKKMGFDDNKSNSIKKVMSKANGDKKAAADKKAKSENTRERKTQGFGQTDKPEASAGARRFGASETTSTGRRNSKKTPEYTDSVKRRVQETLDRYDSNKNGALDRDELGKARWGNPPPAQNDTNGDGRLSRDELSVRYMAREEQYSQARSSTSKKTSSRDTKKTDSSDRRARDRERFRSSGSTKSTTSSKTASPTRSTTTKSSGSDRAKYERYASSLITQYDADKDGKLSKTETKKMRRAPAGADADKDGFITKDELLESLTGGNKAKETAASSGDDKKEKARSKYSRDSSRTSYSSSGSSSSFEKMDADADSNIQMHEFSKKWSDKTVDDFRSKDKNGDGVITMKEWTGK